MPDRERQARTSRNHAVFTFGEPPPGRRYVEVVAVLRAWLSATDEFRRDVGSYSDD
jgi:hypothetical protein